MRSTGGAAPNAALARWLLLFMLLACAGLPPLGGWWPMTLVLSAGLAGGQTMLPGMAVLIGWALITGAIGRCAVDLFRPIDHAAFAARRPEGGRSMLGAAIVVAALIAIAGVAPATLAAPVDAEATRLLEFVATHSQRAYISTIARPLDSPAQPVNATFP